MDARPGSDADAERKGRPRPTGRLPDASWNPRHTTLYVLDGSTTFRIEASVPADTAADRDAAVRIARAVTGSCR